MLGLSLRSREVSVVNVQTHKGTLVSLFLLMLRSANDEEVTFIGNETKQLSERLSSDNAFDQSGTSGR